MYTELMNTVVNTGQQLLNSPTVQSIVTSLITTLFLRKNESVKVIEALKAKKFEKVTDELLETGRLSYVEFYKCKNFLKIAKTADQMVSAIQNNQNETEDEESECGNSFSFDWLMRFFDAVGNISDEKLQELWGKVLANEIVRPKTCSLRTLDIIRNMSPDEAELFSELCRYVVQSGNTYYIDSSGFFCKEDDYQECWHYMKEKGFSYEDSIVPLLEAGVFSADHDLAIYIYKDMSLEIHNDKICGIVMSDDNEPILFQREAYWLTASGREIFQIVKNSTGFETDEKYTLLCMREMKKRNPKFYVGAFEISEQNNIKDLLEDD